MALRRLSAIKTVVSLSRSVAPTSQSSNAISTTLASSFINGGGSSAVRVRASSFINGGGSSAVRVRLLTSMSSGTSITFRISGLLSNKPVIFKVVISKEVTEQQEELPQEDKPTSVGHGEKPKKDKPTNEKPLLTGDEEKPLLTGDEEKPLLTGDEEKPLLTGGEEKPLLTTRKMGKMIGKIGKVTTNIFICAAQRFKGFFRKVFKLFGICYSYLKSDRGAPLLAVASSASLFMIALAINLKRPISLWNLHWWATRQFWTRIGWLYNGLRKTCYWFLPTDLVDALLPDHDSFPDQVQMPEMPQEAGENDSDGEEAGGGEGE